MSDLVAFLRARLDENEAWANESGDRTTHAPESQAHVLADVAVKRTLIATVVNWRHMVLEEDPWYTCAAATEERDGGECADDERRGGPCDCGRDYRAGQVLSALALIYAWHEDHREEWKP